MSAKCTQKSYDNEFKAQAVKLAQEIGGHKAAKELGVPGFFRNCPSFASNGFISVIKYWYQLKAVNDNE